MTTKHGRRGPQRTAEDRRGSRRVAEGRGEPQRRADSVKQTSENRQISPGLDSTYK